MENIRLDYSINKSYCIKYPLLNAHSITLTFFYNNNVITTFNWNLIIDKDKQHIIIHENKHIPEHYTYYTFDNFNKMFYDFINNYGRINTCKNSYLNNNNGLLTIFSNDITNYIKMNISLRNSFINLSTKLKNIF